MIGKKSQLQKDYDELLAKYDKLFSDYSELKFELGEMKVNADNIEKQDEEIRKLHESMRSIKHDMKNHLMVTLSYLNDGNDAAAREYVSQIISKLNSIHSYIETGNSLLNHILNEKFSLARNKGIDVKAEVENLSFEKMESMDFSALLSNMLDNAIEACVVEGSVSAGVASDNALDVNVADDVDENLDGRKLEMKIKIAQAKGYETIVVKNRIAESVLEKNPELKTTKSEKNEHGRGVPQIKAIVEKYEGMCDFFEEDEFFTVCAFIPK